MLNLPADETDQFARGSGTAGDFDDRTTHIKIVVVALVAGIAVAGFGISARTNSDEGYAQTARVMKAGKAVTITSSGTSTVR
jgi:ABC-type phosphate transport system substrate-binding protein